MVKNTFNTRKSLLLVPSKTAGLFLTFIFLFFGCTISEQVLAELNQNSDMQVENKTLLMPDNIYMDLEGPVGSYIDSITENWLLPTCDANPAIIEMFRLRDRNPAYYDPVPWAGEFIGKYLISAIQMCRMTNNKTLPKNLEDVIDELISTQAEDGYLGPWRSNDRLMGHWDLWGHYHVMTALYMYYQSTGYKPALDCALKAADLICSKYLKTDRRVFDAGECHTNMAIIHILCKLYRQTGDIKYLDLSKQIVEEWKVAEPGNYIQGGNYIELAKKGIEFFKTPVARWERLHTLQGLYELFLITSETIYRDSLLHYWRSINKTDVHNNGSFSTKESAIGNPFRDGPIETCCTVAWIAYSIDALKLSKDAKVADQLENALWNAVLAYEHPSGRWCTYDTPMNGYRIASAQTIVFQSRPGTPELNCCSVNGPRGLGMLSEWAVLVEKAGVFLNYYGPGTIDFKTDDGVQWSLKQQTKYPVDGTIKINFELDKRVETTFYLRIPSWSPDVKVNVNGKKVKGSCVNGYLPIKRTWKTGDHIEIELDMPLRYLRGDFNINNWTSLYKGPLLLAYDQKFNFDPDMIPTLQYNSIQCKEIDAPDTRFLPILLLEVKDAEGHSIRLCDFATAGACGTYYRSWLLVEGVAPSEFSLFRPFEGQQFTPDEKLGFYWTVAGSDSTYRLIISKNKDMTEPIFERKNIKETSFVMNENDLDKNVPLYWQVIAENADGQTCCKEGSFSFFINSSKMKDEKYGLIFSDSFDGKATSIIDDNTENAANRFGENGKALSFNGKDSRVAYGTYPYPFVNYTFCVWFKPKEMVKNEDRVQLIACSWKDDGTDPLNLSIKKSSLQASVLDHQRYSTEPIPLENEKWYHAAMVKNAEKLRLYLNGRFVSEIDVPVCLISAADNIGIGYNIGAAHVQEYFSGVIDDISFYRRAMTSDQIRNLYADESTK